MIVSVDRGIFFWIAAGQILMLKNCRMFGQVRETHAHVHVAPPIPPLD